MPTIDPTVAQVLWEPGLPESMEVFEATYSYGRFIVRDGIFQSPCTDLGCCECTRMRRMIGERVPLTLVLENAVEVFITHRNNQAVPLRLIGAGEWFGVFELLDRLINVEPEGKWNVTAGARSAVLLCPFKNSDLRRKLGLADFGDPEQDAWKFVRLFSERYRIDWKVRVLVFPLSAITIHTDPQLLNAFHRIGWHQSSYLRKFHLEQVDPDFDYAEVVRGPDQSLTFAHLTHLFSIARGEAPAFVPVQSCSTQAGPFQEVTARLVGEAEPWRRYLQYYPVFLQPGHLVPGRIGYYSFAKPSLLHRRLDLKNPREFLESSMLRTWDALLASAEGDIFTRSGASHPLARIYADELRAIRFMRTRSTQERQGGTDRPDAEFLRGAKSCYQFTDELDSAEFAPEHPSLRFNKEGWRGGGWLQTIAQIRGVRSDGA